MDLDFSEFNKRYSIDNKKSNEWKNKKLLDQRIKEVEEEIDKMSFVKSGDIKENTLTIYTPEKYYIKAVSKNEYLILNKYQKQLSVSTLMWDNLFHHIRTLVASQNNRYYWCTGAFGNNHDLTEEHDISEFIVERDGVDESVTFYFTCEKCRNAEASEFQDQKLDSAQWEALGQELPIVDDLKTQQSILDNHYNEK